MNAILRAGARLVVENCALYLLSVLFLLLGVLQGIDTPLLGGSGTASDLPLLAVMNAYDLCLVGVLAFLFAKPERREDGYWVAMVALFLLMDPTYFNNRFYQTGLDGSYGLTVNTALLLGALAKLAMITGGAGVPLAKSSVLSLLVALGFVYLAPAPFSLPALGAGAPTFYLLAWTPLLLAFLAPVGGELDPEPVDETERASVRARELRWVALALPFVGVARHGYELASFHGVPLSMAHLAPWMLAAAVLAVRLWPESIDELKPTLGFVAVASLACTLGSDPTLAGAPAGLVWTPLRATLLAQVLAGGYLALRFGHTAFEVHAAVAGMLFLAGGTPEAIAEVCAGPSSWLVLALLGAERLRRRPTLARALVLAFSGAGLLAGLATGRFTGLAHLHLFALGAALALHAWPEEAADLETEAGVFFLVVLGSGALALPGRPGLDAWSLTLAAEAVGLVVAAGVTGRARYRLPGGLAVVAAVVESPLVPWLLAHRVGLGLLASFACLAGGVAVSAHKDELRARLTDPAR